MNPTRVWAKNFRTYESADWQIPSGVTAIVGHNAVTDGSDSNGSGKSSLLELLPIALFGPTMPWSEYLTAGGDAETCEVGCDLEHAGERYRIRRTYSAKGRGSTKLDFEWWEADDPPMPGWRPLTRDSQQATDEAIQQTLGLSEAVFNHSVYAAQGARHFADPSLPPRERKQIMAEALGLDAWEDKVLLVRADIAETKGELAAIEVRLGTFAEEIGQLPLWREAHARHVESAASAARTLADAQTTLDEAVAGLAARKEATAGYEKAAVAVSIAKTIEMQLAGQIAAGREAAEQGKALAETLPALSAAAAEVDRLAAEVASHDTAQAQHETALAERARREKAVVDLRERVKALMRDEASHTAKARAIYDEVGRLEKEGSGVCAHCKQPISGESLKESIESLQHDWAALNDRALALRAEIATATEEGRVLAAALAEEGELGPVGGEPPRAALATARQAERDLATAEERLRQLHLLAEQVSDGLLSHHEEAVAGLERAEAALKAATPEPSAIDWVATKDAAAMQAGLATSADHAERASLAASEEKIRNLEALAGRSEESLLAKDLLEGRLDHLKQMETAYGRNGIPALLMEVHAIPQVEREASRVLEQLGVPFRIELVTQAEKKTGGLKETLDVVVHGPGGPLRFESYSGGEQTRLAFALRVAFARLIAAQRGSEIGVLFIDELTFLDSTGLAAVADVLRGLDEFRSIVLVSHDERLVDSFDSVITVVRDESGSRLVEAA